MPRFTLSLIASLALALPAGAALSSFPTAPVDWLELGTGGSDLMDDHGASMGTVQLTVHNGLVVPGSPSAGLLNSSFWMSSPPILDSLTGNNAIPTFEIRLIPINGAPDYEVEVILPRNFDVLIAIGQLFSDGLDATDRVHLSASSSRGAATPEFLGAFGWDNGLVPFEESLDWDAPASELSPAPGANGESEVALFRINGAERTTITLPSAYGQSTGDSVLFGFAIIPEPSSALLLLSAGTLLLRRRR